MSIRTLHRCPARITAPWLALTLALTLALALPPSGSTQAQVPPDISARRPLTLALTLALTPPPGANTQAQVPLDAGVKRPLALALTSPLGGNAQAQVPPDAGSLRQQIERDRAPPLPQLAAPLEAGEAAALALPTDAAIAVRAFRFRGSTKLSDDALNAVVAPYLERPVGFQDLQRAAQDVARAFRDAGWIARAYLPGQDVTDGLVTIQVVEAVFGGARLEGPESRRLDPKHVLARVQAQQATGQPLNAFALDRALLLADDLAGASVSAALEAGTREGETALVMRITDGPALSGEISLDNGGSRSTGSARLSLQGQLNSPTRSGDVLRAQALLTQGSRYMRLAYDMPIGPQGLQLGVNGSFLSYRLVSPEFAALGSQGRSASAGVDLRWPLLRTRMHNLYLAVSADVRRYRNEANSGTQSRYSTQALSVGLEGNRFDALGAGGATQGSVALHQGTVRQGALDPAEDSSRGGPFTLLRGSLLRRQGLTEDWSVLGTVRGQYAGRLLDSSERFYLGGPDGVRAYPVNEGSGSQGHLASLELRKQVTPAVSMAAFMDRGFAREPSAGSTTLKGAGVSASWTGPNGLSARLTVARRIGQNPNTTAAGNDQDGTRDRTRVWAQASLPF